jgi:cephalosporin-C deacetylase-like acetyl esterase
MKIVEKIKNKIENKIKRKISKKRLIKYVGIVSLSISIIMTIISVSLAFNLRRQKLNFYAKKNIYVESVSVGMRDGVAIKGLIFMNKDLKENDAKSVPTILLLHGINGRKEHKLDIIYQFVKFNYTVVSVEQRGHGESGSPSGFLSKEPYDMMEVIDYLDGNYQFINTSHIGLLGYSYGGGVGGILQAIDDRIHATVLYHPLASLDSLLKSIPLQNLIGTTPTITNLDYILDAMDLANETNTENLLLIQGLGDTLISPSDTYNFYNLVNGTNRADIHLIERPNLGHEGNEKDKTSLKFTIAWFEHFYHDITINITDLDNEISNIKLFNYNYPESSVSENLIIASSIFLFIGLSSLIVKFQILPFWKKLPMKRDVDNSREGKERYKKMIIFRTTAYFGAVIISGIIFSIFNNSFLYGYFIFFPILSSIFMLFFPSELHINWREEWKNWLRDNAPPFLYSLFIIAIPAIYFLVFYNLSASLTIRFTIPIFRITSIPYIVVGIGSGIMDYLYLRELKGRHAMILMVVRPLSVLIFFAFMPVAPFPILGGGFSHAMFIILTGIILYYIRSLVKFLSKFYKNSVTLYLLIMLPFVILYMRVFFRII